jgi:hypothetical protein
MKFGDLCICPLNSQLLNKKCVCASGFTMNNGVCFQNKNTPTPITQCPDKSAWNGTQCICIPTLFMINGTCQSCPTNSEYDRKLMRCICRPGFYGDSAKCVKCKQDCRTCWNGESNGCLSCPAKYKLQNGTCVCNDAGKNSKGCA